jgi:inosose dehydratase
MKVAYTCWTWLINHQDNHKFEFEQSLKEVSYLGYEAVENFAFITDYYDWNAEEVKGLLDKYGLEMANLYHHYRGTDAESYELDYTKGVKYFDFMKKLGAKYMNLQAVMWRDAPNDRPTDRDEILRYAELSNRLGKAAKEEGIIPCFHPHANTNIFREDEVDLYLDNTDPKLVWFCLDTAHTLLGGMDPVAAAKKYASRVGYVHLKDVDPDVNLNPEWPMHRFRPLGQGTVDFRGVYEALKAGGYDGVLCVEQDRQPVCNFHSAMISRQYIQNVLGL